MPALVGLDDDTLVTATVACEQLGGAITAANVRDWARRGLLQPAGAEAGGARLYRLGDVIQVERDTRRSGRGNPATRRRVTLVA